MVRGKTRKKRISAEGCALSKGSHPPRVRTLHTDLRFSAPSVANYIATDYADCSDFARVNSLRFPCLPACAPSEANNIRHQRPPYIREIPKTKLPAFQQAVL
jgi:hypothetical protein